MLTTIALTAALVAPIQPLHPSTPVNTSTRGPIAQHLEQTVFPAPPVEFQPRRMQSGSGDSLKNGAVIGAIAGGLITGAGIGLLCHAFNDNDMNCWAPALLWGAGGAGAGALVGAGIDALFQKRVRVTKTITF